MVQEKGEPSISEITCQEVMEWASAYLDDHVGDERKRQIVLHLAICAGCETYVKQIVTVRELVRALPQAEEVPPDLAQLREVFLARANRQRFNSDRSRS